MKVGCWVAPKVDLRGPLLAAHSADQKVARSVAPTADLMAALKADKRAVLLVRPRAEHWAAAKADLSGTTKAVN